MSYSEEITVSKSAVPTLAVVILAVIFGFGLFLVGYDQGHLFSIIQGAEAFAKMHLKLFPMLSSILRQQSLT